MLSWASSIQFVPSNRNSLKIIFNIIPSATKFPSRSVSFLQVKASVYFSPTPREFYIPRPCHHPLLDNANTGWLVEQLGYRPDALGFESWSGHEIPCNTYICLVQHSYMFRSPIGTITRLWHKNVFESKMCTKIYASFVRSHNYNCLSSCSYPWRAIAYFGFCKIINYYIFYFLQSTT